MARFSEEDRATIWGMREAGVPVKRIAMHLDRTSTVLEARLGNARKAVPNQALPGVWITAGSDLQIGALPAIAQRQMSITIESWPPSSAPVRNWTLSLASMALTTWIMSCALWRSKLPASAARKADRAWLRPRNAVIATLSVRHVRRSRPPMSPTCS